MNRTRINDPLHRKRRIQLRSKDWVRWWIYENTAFERLNPDE